jgi:hypothetical protein
MSKPPSIVSPPSLVARVCLRLLHPGTLYQSLRPRARRRRRRQWKTRPFEPRDLVPVPEGYVVKPPDFVGIASAKAGTTWWYRLLIEHPAVKPNRLAAKELTYFRHFGHRGPGADAIETYRQAFAAPKGCLCGEWSPIYVSYPLAVNYLGQAAPDAKLIAILRNPVDRTRSFLSHALSIGAQRPDLGRPGARPRNALSMFRAAVSSGLLCESFVRLLRVFDRSKLLLLQYERCALDPGFEIARTYRFLGLDDSFIPASIDRKVNVRPYVVPQLEPHERAILADYFSDDVRGLAELFPELDLSLWPDFEDH